MAVQDYEQYFTKYDGQLFNAADGVAEYGDKAYDQKAARDAAIGAGPIDFWYQVVDANSNVGTSLDIAVVQDDDGAGTNEAALVTKTVLVANLTTAKGVQRIGRIYPGQLTKRQMRAKVTSHGAAATAGKIRVWFTVGSEAMRANAAGTL